MAGHWFVGEINIEGISCGRIRNNFGIFSFILITFVVNERG